MAGHRTSRVERLRKRIVGSLEELGPGLVTGAADDDPSGIATYSQAGAQFGYGLMWTMLLCYPLMSAVQLVSAHIGRVTGTGLRPTISPAPSPSGVVGLLIAILLIANIINVGADLSAMAEAAQLVTGGGEHSVRDRLCDRQHRAPAVRAVPTLREHSEVVDPQPFRLCRHRASRRSGRLDRSACRPGLANRDLGRDALLTIVALLGTTISPYLFFWQSSQEAEELATSNHQADQARAAQR